MISFHEKQEIPPDHITWYGGKVVSYWASHNGLDTIKSERSLKPVGSDAKLQSLEWKWEDPRRQHFIDASHYIGYFQ